MKPTPSTLLLAILAVFPPDPADGTCPGRYLVPLPADARVMELSAPQDFSSLESVLDLRFGAGGATLEFLEGRVVGSVIVDFSTRAGDGS